MNISRHSYGYDAEKMVIKYYQNMRFELLFHRFRNIAIEIDIIMKNANTIVFIEVKARNNPSHQEFLTLSQMRKYCIAAQLFIALNDFRDFQGDFRFDLALVVNDRIDKIIENAWTCDC